MSGTPGTAEFTQFRRLRLSQVATRLHDDLAEIGDPDRFETLLQIPGCVRDIDLTLPYLDSAHTKVDIDLWSLISEVPLTGPVNASAAKNLRKHSIPLRAKAKLTANLDGNKRGAQYIDIHVHPFGVVAISTLDISWIDPVPIADGWAKVAQIEKQPATIQLGEWSQNSTVSSAADAVAEHVLSIFANSSGHELSVPSFRAATVIDGVVEPPRNAMPLISSPLHQALHYLCGGSSIFPAPADAFVPLWSGAGFQYSPSNLLYLLDSGVALFGNSPLTRTPGLTFGMQHRRLILLLAHLSASVGLIGLAKTYGAVAPTAWARTAANRLARLYGPEQFAHGMEPQRYLNQSRFRASIESFLGNRLMANPNFPPPSYL